MITIVIYEENQQCAEENYDAYDFLPYFTSHSLIPICPTGV